VSTPFFSARVSSLVSQAWHIATVILLKFSPAGGMKASTPLNVSAVAPAQIEGVEAGAQCHQSPEG